MYQNKYTNCSIIYILYYYLQLLKNIRKIDIMHVFILWKKLNDYIDLSLI